MTTAPGTKRWCSTDYGKPYPVPKVHEQLFKDEAGYIVSDGVLERVGATEHAYPTFIIPRKDGRIHWVSDF
jgi:hypothetical protein